MIAAALLAFVTLNYTVLYPQTTLPPGQQLTLRGADAQCVGVSWSSGAPLQRVRTDTFEALLRCDAALVANGTALFFKAVLGASAFQIGANVALTLQRTSLTQTHWTFVSTPNFIATAGQYFVAASLASRALNNTRDVVVYVPPVVLENPYATTRVLIMHDGQNVFNDSTSFAGVSWQAASTIDALINAGAMQQIIVVGLYNTDARIDEYTYVADPTEMAGGQGDLYLDFIEHDVLPWIASNLPVASVGRADVGMLGSSLGGLISCYAGYTRSHVYGRVGCMSSSFWWDSDNFNNTIVGSQPLPRADTVFYIDSGDMQQGGCAPPQDCDDRVESVDVREHLRKLGWRLNSTLFYYLQHGGVHNEASWAARFWVPMTSLYAPLVESC